MQRLMQNLSAMRASLNSLFSKKQYLRLPASAFTPKAVGGPAASLVTTVTNLVGLNVLSFDAAAVEGAQVNLALIDWNHGTIKAKFYWDSVALGTGNVVRGIKANSHADDDALDIAFGTGVLVTDTILSVGDLHISGATAAVTIAATPAIGDLLTVEVYRKADDAGDTSIVDANLIGVMLEYTGGALAPVAW